MVWSRSLATLIRVRVSSIPLSCNKGKDPFFDFPRRSAPAHRMGRFHFHPFKCHLQIFDHGANYLFGPEECNHFWKLLGWNASLHHVMKTKIPKLRTKDQTSQIYCIFHQLFSENPSKTEKMNLTITFLLSSTCLPVPLLHTEETICGSCKNSWSAQTQKSRSWRIIILGLRRFCIQHENRE